MSKSTPHHRPSMHGLKGDPLADLEKVAQSSLREKKTAAITFRVSEREMQEWEELAAAFNLPRLDVLAVLIHSAYVALSENRKKVSDPLPADESFGGM